MAGRVEQRINDKYYFVIDEVGGSSGIESETVSDEEVMSSSRDEPVSAEKSIVENNSNNSQVSIPAGEHNVQGCGINSAAGNADNRDSEFININSTEGNTDGTGSGPTSVSNDGGKEISDGINSETTNMDIDNESDGEIEQEIEDEIEPIIKISFRDERIEKMYKSSILQFLTQKIHFYTVVQSRENSLGIEIYEGKSGKEQDDDVLDFHLDTTPNFDSHSNRVPSYGKNHDVLLSDSNSTEEKKRKSEFSNAPVCFNCCGNHLLRDCPNERDIRGIMKNRAKFQATSKVQKASRYHLDENQKFGDLVPGELTKKLRNALDLHKNQQPLFIYRMRMLGYPPAWLEEARVSHSGVAIYDSNGVPISEEDEEEGEIVPEGAKDRFDISKIIEFPGFNVPLEKNMKEEGKLHCCPAMSKEQSKENMIKTLEPNAVRAYKKRTLTLQKYSSQEGNPTKPEKRLPSPTIEEMEEKKRQLLMALNDEDVTDPNAKSTESTESAGKEDLPSEKVCDQEEIKCESPESTNVKVLDYGTPILKSISPYSKLPSRESFSVNVSDVINFENLPNSTGKYESMSNLIHKIRDTVTRIQNE